MTECSFRRYRALVAAASLLFTAVVCLVLCMYVSRYPGQINETTERATRSTTQELDVDQQQLEQLLEDQRTIKSELYCHFETKCKIIKCSRIPKHLDPGEVTSSFIEETFKVECNVTIGAGLTLEKSTFPNNELQERWLRTDVAIEQLTLVDCSLTTLSDGAFSSPIYSTTRKLYLSNNNISTLRRATFRHLPSLRDLSVVSNEIREAEKNLLSDVARTLQSLQLEIAVANTEVLRNITGGSVLPEVRVLSLRYNDIPIIDSGLFAGVPGVVSLYLCDSRVRTIRTRAFEAISGSVRQLLLCGNSIATLPRGLFDTIIRRNPHFNLAIDRNPWHCDCGLEWMRNMVRDYPDVTVKTPICKSPEKNAGETFATANFCDGQTTSGAPTAATAAISDATASTLKTSSANESRINCEVIINRLLYSNGTLWTSSTSDLGKFVFLDFYVIKLENGTAMIKLPSTNNVFLVWFANDARSSIASLKESMQCVGGVRDFYILHLRDFHARTSYTICMFDDLSFSPLNCLGVTADLSLDKPDPELAGGDTGVLITVFVLSLVLMCFVSAVLMFLVVRRHPAMLRGSKRIVIVKRRAVDAVVLPKGLSHDTVDCAGRHAIPTISRNFRENSYVTPLPPVRKNSTRKSSQCSASSVQSDAGTSYISGIEPTLAQLNLWRLQRTKYMNWDVEPPPLPPHPQRNVIAQPLSIVTDLDEDEFMDSTSTRGNRLFQNNLQQNCM